MTAIQSAQVYADFWRPLCRGNSSNEIFHSWASSLRQHLDADEVGIWTTNDATSTSTLAGYACRGQVDVVPLTEHPAIKSVVPQVCASQRPLAVVGCDPDWHVTNYPAEGEHVKVAVVLIPIRVDDHPLGLVALRPAQKSAAIELSLLETLIAQVGSGLALLQRQARLQQLQRSHDTLLLTASSAIVSLDSEYNVRSWNAGAERIFGWRASDVVGRRLPIVPFRENDQVLLCCQGAFAGRSTTRIETKAVTHARKIVDIALSASPLFSEHGAVESALLVAEAITDRKRAESLVHLQSRIAKMLAHGTTIEDTIFSVLTLMCSLQGWDCGEYWVTDGNGGRMKRQVSAHLSSASAAFFDREMTTRGERDSDALVARALAAAQPVWISDFSSDRRGDRAALAAQCNLNDAIGFRIVYGEEIVGVILFVAEHVERPDAQFLVCLDAISEQIGQFVRQQRTEESLRAAEKKLFQSQKLETIGRLVGGVVHDFNNLMTVILGYGDLLLYGNVAPDLTREALLEMLDAGKHAARLTRRLLAFSRKESLGPVTLNVNTVIQELQAIIRRLIGNDVELRLDLADALHHVSADVAQIEQIVMNLVINARDAMQAGGLLRISTRNVEVDNSRLPSLPDAVLGPHVRLSVSDTGCGIDAAVQPRIFDAFFSTKPLGIGTGIGLSTVYDNVRNCGGHILVESKPAHGTTFDLYFPAAFTGLASWVVDPPRPPSTTGRETVLVVDDEVRVRRLVGLILKALGYTVLEADGPDAIEIEKQYSGAIDLLIADLIMPGVNGISVAERILKSRPDVAVLWMSGYASADVICGISDGGKRPFLHKPFTSHELASMVRQVLDE